MLRGGYKSKLTSIKNLREAERRFTIGPEGPDMNMEFKEKPTGGHKQNE